MTGTNLPDTIHHKGSTWTSALTARCTCRSAQLNSEINPGTTADPPTTPTAGLEIVARGVRTGRCDWTRSPRSCFNDNGRAGGRRRYEDGSIASPRTEKAPTTASVLPRHGGRRRPRGRTRAPACDEGSLDGPASARSYEVLHRQNVRAYQNAAFVGRRGSWTRAQKFGYDVVVAKISAAKPTRAVLTGLLDEKATRSRPYDS